VGRLQSINVAVDGGQKKSNIALFLMWLGKKMSWKVGKGGHILNNSHVLSKEPLK